MASLRRTHLAGAAGVAVILLCLLSRSDAFDPLDPDGKIIVKWDVMQWTADGYVAAVNIYNTQQYRHIDLPGWILGWHWATKEVIWGMVGAQATMQGDCSRFHSGNLPHSCKPDPQIVDLLPGVAYNSQTANCCRGGVLSSYLQDPANAVAAFQVSVGMAGNSNTTVKLPKNFTLATPGPGYTCSPAKLDRPTLFPTADGRRNSQALMTWNVTCTYTQKLAQRAPTCCVSYSAFYNSTIVPCQTCSCACKVNITSPTDPTCVDPANKKAVEAAIKSGSKSQGLFCTNDMCPVKIHWHVKANYLGYWRVKITITNRNLFKNYTQWNVVAQHPNFNMLYETYTFKYKGISPYGDINDTAVFFRPKGYQDMLVNAGGNDQGEILFAKDERFTFKQGWAFPRRIYYNGDDCVLPGPEDYPWLPNGAVQLRGGSSLPLIFLSMLAVLALFTF
eukprot:TRINITY_DN7735_c0_g1_i1.p1 TRINITY_DN7735_c0_g1~~TRINITY_DN7735_c0_g1_i1.p1  ORF type:complete len:447 (-),score=29.49 TRINITY_DN7735_c0_g1_i1:912-2252(-)